MGFRGDDGLERELRASRPQLGSDVEDRIVARVASAPARRGRGTRMFVATVFTVGSFGMMSAFGGMSYASQVLGGNSGHGTPASDQYCGSGSEPDHNGDLHSNCHTGSKHRGAGGEDKPGAKG